MWKWKGRQASEGEERRRDAWLGYDHASRIAMMHDGDGDDDS